ncbi:hypothetical protein KGY64_05745, partial [Candidatus Bipolaricaulota bacterium]|nr:hypothetical protein [Candidatus Bipolaricaulota bacterium]
MVMRAHSPKISFLIAVMAILLVTSSGQVFGVDKEKAIEPLNLAIIWHQHQPLYKNAATEFYELPWARVHAAQEYYDSPLILTGHPDIRVTYNLVPSLIDQIEDYGEITSEERDKGGTYNFIGATDPHLELALANPAELTEEERETIEEEFFWINPYPLDDDGDDPYFFS